MPLIFSPAFLVFIATTIAYASRANAAVHMSAKAIMKIIIVYLLFCLAMITIIFYQGFGLLYHFLFVFVDDMFVRLQVDH